MATFTSSLPDNILEQLSKAAKDLKLLKNKIIEKALEIEHKLTKDFMMLWYKELAKKTT